MKLKDENVRNLLRRAIDLWGEENQWRQLVEELCEMGAAFNRHRRNRINNEVLAEEIADVFIMVQQADIMLGGVPSWANVWVPVDYNQFVDNMLSYSMWVGRQVCDHLTDKSIQPDLPMSISRISAVLQIYVQDNEIQELVDKHIDEKISRLKKRVQES